MDKIAVFIDDHSTNLAKNLLNINIDYGRVLQWVGARGKVQRATYFALVVEDEGGHAPVKRLVDWLEFNGYTARTRKVTPPIRTNMNVEIALAMSDISEYVDEIVLFAGVGDLEAAVDAVRRKGVRVTVVSTMAKFDNTVDEKHAPLVSNRLRRAADEFVELRTIASAVQMVRPAAAETPLVERAEAIRDQLGQKFRVAARGPDKATASA